MADVREELRLRPVELRERLRPTPLTLAGARVLETRRDLSGDESDEPKVAFVELPVRVDRRNQKARRPLLSGLSNRHDNGLSRWDVPGAGRYSAEPFVEVINDDPLVAGAERRRGPRLLGIPNADRRDRRGMRRLYACRPGKVRRHAR